MKTKIYYLLLLIMMFLMSSCGKSPRTETDSVLEYDVIEIDSCEYIMVQSQTYGIDLYVTSISHKGNCKYCKERNSLANHTETVYEKGYKVITDTVYVYRTLIQ